ncbi:hypothetical protein P171DRAFT_483077 [Karstenula rhodostoma CBS 690.94]|uniref:Uncharacterized protein n=1 Tax=Karstenula rhodostoma CBS 690.94 TaxID=1392251 RepID=A0A9P4PN25_9PLEO|nr:hypothetical protein P171DRAFT_483077 [Karstenula rhodostoma CBS 690.94]
MTKLSTAASIGIGVPLGVILLAAFAGIIYSVMAKRKTPRGDVELTKTDPAAPPAPEPKLRDRELNIETIDVRNRRDEGGTYQTQYRNSVWLEASWEHRVHCPLRPYGRQKSGVLCFLN